MINLIRNGLAKVIEKFSSEGLFLSLGRLFFAGAGLGFGGNSSKSEVRLASKLLIKKDKLIIWDVGANIGEYTQALLYELKNCHVYSFEPSPSAYKKLKNRFTNKEDRVNIFPFALGNEEGFLPLFGNFDGSVTSSLTQRQIQDLKFQKLYDVEVKTLKIMAKELQHIPDMLKLDVEGAELDVLKGGKEIAKEIKLIQFEHGAASLDAGIHFKDLFQFMTDLNRDIYIITPFGLKHIPKYLPIYEF